MLSGEGNENGEKMTIGLISQKSWKKKSFVRLQCETSRNFLVTLFMEELSNVFLFTVVSTVALFHPGGR